MGSIPRLSIKWNGNKSKKDYQYICLENLMLPIICSPAAYSGDKMTCYECVCFISFRSCIHSLEIYKWPYFCYIDKYSAFFICLILTNLRINVNIYLIIQSWKIRNKS